MEFRWATAEPVRNRFQRTSFFGDDLVRNQFFENQNKITGTGQKFGFETVRNRGRRALIFEVS